jgi:rod shape-determining protein MreD
VSVWRVLLAIGGALALQTTLGRFVIHGWAALDLVLVVVVYVALASGPVTGLLAGAVAGLAQDALSSGVVGIGGLAKTIVGFTAGTLGTHLVVSRAVSRFLVFAIATVAHGFIFVGLYVVLGLREFDSAYAAMFSQAAGNGVAGVLLLQTAELLPGAMDRRRATRGARMQRRFEG